MPTIQTWILIMAFVAFVLIPICWKFWRGWDRPSRAAKAEMARRKEERDIRETFLKEDAKVREEQRLESQRELARQKAQAPPPVSTSLLAKAFGNLEEPSMLGNQTDRTGTEVLTESVGIRRESLVETGDVSELVNQLDITEIADDIEVPDTSPVAVQLHPSAGKEKKDALGAVDVTWSQQDSDDDWNDVGW
ncbi:MAG: hypothetical protein QF440_02705 [Candidatus Thalassarchaeaceae archaeon]|nr:hypothetical protein [Candidatus Thalassarchaeaceae archaeon]